MSYILSASLEKARKGSRINARAGPPPVTSTQRLPNSSVAPVAAWSLFPLCLSPLCSSCVYLLFPSIGFTGGTISDIFKGAQLILSVYRISMRGPYGRVVVVVEEKEEGGRYYNY